MTTEPEPTVELDPERLARIARLQARRSTTTGPDTTTSQARRRRRHPARDSRIAATAIGVSALFGLVTAYGVAAGDTGAELTEVAPDPAPGEPIVIQLRLVAADGSSVVAADAVPPGPAAADAVQAPSVPAAAPSGPAVRVLSAPDPVQAPAGSAPVEARTSGSR